MLDKVFNISEPQSLHHPGAVYAQESLYCGIMGFRCGNVFEAVSYMLLSEMFPYF